MDTTRRHGCARTGGRCAFSLLLGCSLASEAIGVGACCTPEDTCFETSQEVCVDVVGGTFFGEGSDCNQVGSCANGACCVPIGLCISRTEFECDQIPGAVFQGIGVPCAEVICVEGACCLPDGTCLSTVDCDAFGGCFKGQGTRCEVATCDSDVIRVPEDFPTIAAALANASACDVVLVGPGTYFETLLLTPSRPLTVMSSGGPEKTVVMPSSTSALVKALAGTRRDAVFEGFTLRGLPNRPRALELRGDCIIRDCIIEEFVAPPGSVNVSIINADPTFIGCRIQNNTSPFLPIVSAIPGGPNGTTNPSFIDCVFAENTAPTNLSATFGVTTLLRCDFRRGSVRLEGAVVTGCSFASVKCDDGIAYALTIDEGVVSDSVFIDNARGLFGIGSGFRAARNCTFFGHRDGCEIGGFEFGSFPILSVQEVSNCIFWDNLDPNGAPVEVYAGLIEHSIVQGWTGKLGGTGNSGEDPRIDVPESFLDDPRAGAGLRLLPLSPAIDAGRNASVAPDVLDLDGDGDTNEPLPFDFAGLDRFVDDPLVDDTGDGPRPLVDLGALEYQPTAPGGAGPRLWIGSAAGVFSDPGNWAPDTPGPSDVAIFDPSKPLSVTVDGSTSTNRLIVGGGAVDLDLGGSLLAIGSDADEAVMVGPFASEPAVLTLRNGALVSTRGRIGRSIDSNGVVRLEGPQVNWIVGDELLLGRGGSGTLELAGGGITVGSNLILDRFATLSGIGPGKVEADVTNVGIVDPGTPASFGSLRLDDLTQTGTLEGGSVAAGTVRIDLGGLVPETQHDVLTVTGTATLAGSLVVELADDFTPLVGDEFVVVEAPSVVGTFDVALLPGLPGGAFMRVEYRGIGPGGATEVVLVVDDLTSLFEGFDDPEAVALAGVPSGVATGDLDGANGIDLAITVPAADEAQPGSVLVLLNAGTDGSGAWLGFQSASQTTVGLDPRDLTIADLDDDGFLDVAVANGGDRTVSILVNDGGGSGTFLPPVSFIVQDADPMTPPSVPISIVAARFGPGRSIDLAVGLGGENRIAVLANAGDGLTYVNAQSIAVVGEPCVIEPEDMDEDRDTDLVVGVCGASSVVVALQGAGGAFNAQSIVVGSNPQSLAVSDLDLDGLPDIVSANAGAASVSVIGNNGGGTFAAAANLPVGAAPRSVTTYDREPDGDRDIALIANDGDGAAYVQVLRNDLDDGQLIFAPAEAVDLGAEPLFVLGRDVDGDGLDDLVALSAGEDGASPAGDGGDTGPLGPSASAAVNLGSPACAADLDQSGEVGLEDLLAILSSWGPCGGCPADIDGDGDVGFIDVVLLLAEWGTCP